MLARLTYQVGNRDWSWSERRETVAQFSPDHTLQTVALWSHQAIKQEAAFFGAAARLALTIELIEDAANGDK